MEIILSPEKELEYQENKYYLEVVKRMLGVEERNNDNPVKKSDKTTHIELLRDDLYLATQELMSINQELGNILDGIDENGNKDKKN